MFYSSGKPPRYFYICPPDAYAPSRTLWVYIASDREAGANANRVGGVVVADDTMVGNKTEGSGVTNIRRTQPPVV